jgi:hypothetical protein
VAQSAPALKIYNWLCDSNAAVLESQLIVGPQLVDNTLSNPTLSANFEAGACKNGVTKIVAATVAIVLIADLSAMSISLTPRALPRNWSPVDGSGKARLALRGSRQPPKSLMTQAGCKSP